MFNGVRASEQSKNWWWYCWNHLNALVFLRNRDQVVTHHLKIVALSVPVLSSASSALTDICLLWRLASSRINECSVCVCVWCCIPRMSAKIWVLCVAQKKSDLWTSVWGSADVLFVCVYSVYFHLRPHKQQKLKLTKLFWGSKRPTTSSVTVPVINEAVFRLWLAKMFLNVFFIIWHKFKRAVIVQNTFLQWGDEINIRFT